MSDAVANPSGTVHLDGPINVDIENNFTLVSIFNEITNVPAGIETTIASFQATSANKTYLQIVKCSSQNIGEVKVYKNSDVMDKNYLYYTTFNIDFDYRTTIPSLPGIPLIQNDTIYVKGLNNSTSTCNFNAKIQVLEAISA